MRIYFVTIVAMSLWEPWNQLHLVPSNFCNWFSIFRRAMWEAYSDLQTSRLDLKERRKEEWEREYTGRCGAITGDGERTEVNGKVKFSHTRYLALGPKLIPLFRQSARR